VTRPAALLLHFHIPFTHEKAAADSAEAAVHVTHALGLEKWHDFYLLAGTAAVTLVGLLFVALSFHLDTLLHDSKTHLLAAARMAFMNFIYVLLLSLFFLMPDAPPVAIGGGVLALSAVILCFLVWNAMHARHSAALTEHERFLRRRFAIAGLVLGISIVASINFLAEPRHIFLLQMVTVTAVMLANAAGMAWDLLVQVGRIRKSSGEKPEA